MNFNQIPGLVLTPGTYIEMDSSRMLSGLPTPKTRVLIAGQILATGTMAANTLTQVFSPTHAKLLAGEGSMLAAQVASYFANDKTTEVWVVGLADAGGGVAATGSIVFAGPATEAGTLKLMICDQRVPVTIASAMISTAVATAVAAAINLFPDLPVVATVNASTVTLTARHKGVESNDLLVKLNYDQGDVKPAGLTVTITTIGGVIAGATNPDATQVFTAIGDEPFASIIHPWTDATNLGIIEVACRARADAMTMNYSEAYTFKAGSYATLTTLITPRNSEFQCIAGLKGSPSAPWKIGAALGAKVTWWSRNNLGCPFTDIVLAGILPPLTVDNFDREDRELLLEAGCSTLKVTVNGDVVIERMVTLRKKNAQGFADAGLRSLNAMLLYFYQSWSQQARIAARFSGYKLGDDGNYGPNARVATPSIVRGELVALATDWFEAGLIENIDQYITDLKVTRDPSNPDRLNSFQRPDLINEFNVLAVQVQPIA